MKNLLKVCLLVIVLALGSGEASGQFVWTKDAHNPVLSGGAIGEWNRYIDQPCVLFNADSSRYEMWFEGYAQLPGGHPIRIGFAHSADRVNWTVYPLPVLSPDSGAWDAYTVDFPRVIRENGHYKMWYLSYGSGSTDPDYIGYATSPDGIHWSKYAGNPVLRPGPAAWDAGGPWGHCIVPFPGGYKIWYAGYTSLSLPPPHHTSIGYATSADGITWVKDTLRNPVLGLDSTGSWDDAYVLFPQVLQIGKRIFMWYTGFRSTINPSEVGTAVSLDSGKTWTRNPSNPVLVPSGPGWDGNYIEGGTVLRRGDTLDMWYDGSLEPTATNLWRIGHATSHIPDSVMIGVTGAKELANEIPYRFALHQNYPNPFNPSTTISFELSVALQVKLSVFDILGREVSELVHERKNAGVHEIKFDGSHLASGVYFYRLQAGDFVQSKRFVLLR